MNLLEAIVFGIIQGLTEFLPVSSSAHIRIAGAMFASVGDPGAAFTAIVQIGTELAVLVYFRQELFQIATSWFNQMRRRTYVEHDARLGWLIVIGSGPIVVLGLLGQSLIETSLRNLYITAFMLIFFGILLALADQYGRKQKIITEINWRDGLKFGFAQALALIPGVSRSGGTITAGLAMGYTRDAAARYSFLLAIPAVFGSGAYQIYKNYGEWGKIGALETGLSALTAFVVGYAVIVGFLKLVSTTSYRPFVYYRLILGVVLLLLLGAEVIPADAQAH